MISETERTIFRGKSNIVNTNIFSNDFNFFIVKWAQIIYDLGFKHNVYVRGLIEAVMIEKVGHESAANRG